MSNFMFGMLLVFSRSSFRIRVFCFIGVWNGRVYGFMFILRIFLVLGLGALVMKGFSFKFLI